MLEFILFSCINSLLYGLLLFMLSSGLTLIFGLMNVLNFAHASFFMLGAYFAYEISTYIGFWPALVFAPLGVGVVGIFIERYGLRSVHKYGHVAELLFTFGVFYVIDELVILIWGRNPVPYEVPGGLDFTLLTIMNTNFSAYRAFMLLISVAMFAVLFFVITRSRLGLIIQAALTHPETVGALGHNVPSVFMYVFGGGAALAGLAGVIGGNYLITEPAMAQNLGPIVFVVVVVGGMGSLTGAFVASLLIAALQTFAVGMEVSLSDLLALWDVYIPEASGIIEDLLRIQVSHTRGMLPYLFMVLMLVFKPKGLMGTREE
ncbi:MAG: branched-chain amino acid ABC transporter permease [Desulfobacterales bacterium]|nr:branched-chain amino acid ABC transporter permease [Desulfobacterales bacterium]MBS3755267.1 branched-chain amino acid ABC transporter permease [Desulfobacterales bacterium]